MRKRLIFAIVFFITACFVIPAFAAANLAVNPSFEEGNGAFPDGWQTVLYDLNPGVTEFKYEKSGGHSGTGFVTIINHGKNDARLKQEIFIKEHSLYRISCWVKTVNVGAGMGANISIEGRLETSPDIKGSSGKWEYIELYVKTGSGISSMVVTFGLGGYGSVNTGQASFDDVVVEEIGIPEGAAVIQLGNIPEPEKNRPAIDFASIGGPTTAIWTLIIAASIVALAGTGFYFWLLHRFDGNKAL